MAVTYQTRNAVDVKAPKQTRLQQEARIGWLFIAPWVIGFILLKALPILAALVFSLTDFQMLTPESTRFVGLSNYVRFFGDTEASASLYASLRYFLLTVPLELIVAIVLAAIFTSDRLKNKSILRTLIFMTSIIPATSIFFIFLGSIQYADRLIFQPLNMPPLEGFDLLVPFMALWSIGPGFLIMYSAMESVPRELYEAARVDGAGKFAQFFYITLPMVSPATFFTLVVNLTGAFGGAVLLDRGYILNFSLSPMEQYINNTMFTESDLGYASALAWVTFAVMMTLTIFLFSSAKYWVHFPEEHDNNET